VGISQKKSDLASIAPPTPKGGIDLNAANMAMVIKRNGKGVPLPFSQQNMSQLSRLAGFDPILGEIISVNFMPVISELRAKLEGNKSPQIARTAIQGIAQVT